MGISIKHVSKKKPSVAKTETEGWDRISNLHETVFFNIFSHLPTKDAVRTSILSKGWKQKWVSMDNVDTDLECWGTSRGLNFADFLDEVLILCQHLRRFRTTFRCAMSNRVQEWVNAALLHNLENLDININGNSVVIPSSLINHNSLREVKVVQPFPDFVQLCVEEKNCAPKLTSLSLHNIKFVNENRDFSSVSFDFPVLETLEFRGNTFRSGRWRNVKSVIIYAPSLTSFSYESTWFRPLFGYDYSIKVVAPRLTRFSSFNHVCENLIFDGSTIVSAILSGWNDLSSDGSVETRATHLLNGFTNLEELTLSCCMAEVLRNGPSVHRHDKLKRLTLHCGCNANQLFKLLHVMPTLKFLSVNVDKWEDYSYEGMGTIPCCIVSHMEEIVLQVFSGKDSQYKLAMFLSNAAKQLKKLTITANDAGHCEQMKKTLSSTFLSFSPSFDICCRLPDIEPTYTLEML